jgi:putative hemolysin
MLNGAEFLIALSFIIALLLMSIIDVAFTNVSKVAVRRLMEGPKFRAATTLSRLVEDKNEVLMSLHIIIQLLLVAGAVFVFTVFDRREMRYTVSVFGTVGVMMLVLLIFRHFVPRIIAMRRPERVLVGLFPVFRLSQAALRPVSRLLMSGLRYFQQWEQDVEPVKEEETSEEEIQAFIDAGQEEGILEREEGEMIQSIVHFGDKVAREVMTPRTQVVAIEVNSSIDQLLHVIITSHHARIPVFRDELDNIEGIVHERDLLRVLQRGEKPANFRTLVKPAYFVPETKPVDDLLQEMKEKGDHMVLVVDEYGGVSGLITMEDLIEEIVGEIRDEAEGEDEKVIEEAKGILVVPGTLELGVLEERLGVPLVADTGCTTVAGAVVELFGRLPSPGEKIEHGGIEIEVLASDRRRVQQLRLKTLAPKADE